MTTRLSRRVATPGLLLAAGALAAVTGCSGTADSTRTTHSTGVVHPAGAAPTHHLTTHQATVGTVSSPAPRTQSTPQNIAQHRPTKLPECKAGSLALSFGGHDEAMNQQERVLRFTNTGSGSCVIVGFPGVSYVAGDNGHQVGAAAVRTGTIRPQVTLAPGQVASTVIHFTNAGVFDPAACRPTPVRGLRIYAPDDTAAMFIPITGSPEGCAGTTPDPQLSVVSIKPGLGDPDQP